MFLLICYRLVARCVRLSVIDTAGRVGSSKQMRLKRQNEDEERQKEMCEEDEHAIRRQECPSNRSLLLFRRLCLA
jgi:hypothetical protein